MKGNKIKMVNEFRTSRLCARCFSPFPLATLSHRFKVCEWCTPNDDDWPDGLKLPRKIVTMKSKRELLSERRDVREAMIVNPNQAVGFVSKMTCFRKNWQQNAVNGTDYNVVQLPDHIHDENVMDFAEDSHMPNDFEDDFPYVAVLTTIWHRDISAAKLIMYRG